MLPLTTLGLGAVIAAVAAGWNQVKSYLVKFSGYFVHRLVLDEPTAFRFCQYLRDNQWKPTITTSRFMLSVRKYLVGKKELRWVIHESYLSPSEPILVRKGVNFIQFDGVSLKVHAPKWVNIDAIFKDLNITAPTISRSHVDFYIVRAEGSRFRGYVKGGEKNADVTQPPIPDKMACDLPRRTELISPVGMLDSDFEDQKSHRFLNNLWLNSDMTALLQESQTWIKKKDWFLDRGVPWKRGFLFYGKPGTGKTKFGMALAQELNIPIFIFDLASMTNADLVRSYQNYQVDSGRVVLIEDIDAVFDKRTNVTATQQSPGLTFDCLLNTLDGVETGNGTLVIITTNDPSKLDDALIRPGRIDRKLQLQGLDRAGRLWMARKIFFGFEDRLWVDLVDKSEDGVTGAVFQEDCCRRALDLFWAESTHVGI